MKNLLVLLFLILTACPGPQGNQGDIGQTGAVGVAGSNGTNGQDGQSIVGSQGPAGANGQDATPVTWVQFCPGTTSYPSTFVEGGFCISGNVYAVYSANGGFMTYIPPGSYNSNAINSSCNFTLLANCIIQ